VAIQSFTVTRHVPAEDAIGRPCKIALATIIHENGQAQTVAIPEDKIQFEGEDIIESEVLKAALSPTAPGLAFQLGRKPQ
jgi:hypothetical protein